jgi:hypothetical protein
MMPTPCPWANSSSCWPSTTCATPAARGSIRSGVLLAPRFGFQWELAAAAFLDVIGFHGVGANPSFRGFSTTLRVGF